MPGENKPLMNFEPILQTLKRLDPENEHHFFLEIERKQKTMYLKKFKSG